MKDLKIDSELRDLLPPLSKEKFEKLEKLILTEGYDGTPILVWNGYIVDGHHRYKIFKKHNIEFNTEDISLPKDCDKSQVMDWMLTYQVVRRNLSDAEKIFINDKVSLKRIKEENERKMRIGRSIGGQGGYSQSSVQMDRNLRKIRNRSTNTREQRAKQSGVSSGTISRYDAVMNSDDEDLKQSMLSGEVKIGTAYKKVIDSKKKENTNIEPSISSKSLNKQNDTTQQQYDEQTKKICEFMKTERKDDYNYDINSDINSLHHLFNKMISDMNDSIFDNHEMMGVISKIDCDTLIGFLKESKEGINSIIEKLEEIRNEQSKNIIKKPNVLDGIVLKNRPINVYKLYFCLDYQRDIDASRVQRIYDDWIDGYYERPLVNYINGEYRLIGGQHTVAAFIKRIENGLEETTTIECRMAENLTEAQEAALFKYDEDCKKAQTYDSKLSAHWNYTGIDLTDENSRKLYDVNEILNKYGYTVKCNKNENMAVDCTETLLDMDNFTLDNAFNFIHEIFPHEKCATQAVFLKAVTYFLQLFSDDIDIKKFKTAAKGTKTRKVLSASFLIDDSKNYVQYKNKAVKQIAYAISVAYQQRVKNGKLPLYKFDM